MAGLTKSAVIKLILEYIGGKRLQQAQTVFAEQQKVARVASGGLSLAALKGMVLNKLSGLVPLPDLNTLLPTSLSSITAPITGAVTSAENLTKELLQNPVADVITTVQGQLGSANSIISGLANTNPLLSNTQIATLTTSLGGLTNAVSTFQTHTDTLSGLLDNTPTFITSNNVNDYISNSAVVANLSSNVASLSTNVSSLSTNVSHLSSNVTSLSSNVTSLSANVATRVPYIDGGGPVGWATGEWRIQAPKAVVIENPTTFKNFELTTNNPNSNTGVIWAADETWTHVWGIGEESVNSRYKIQGDRSFEFTLQPYIGVNAIATEAYVDAAVSAAGGGDVTNTYLQATFSNNTTLASDLAVKADNTYVVGTFAQNTAVYGTFAQNTAVYATFAQNTAVYSVFAQNSAVYGTFAQNTYVNTQLGLKANTSGDTFTGRINAVASSTGGASIRLPHGAAPTAPANGDMWTTSTGLFTYIGSATWQFANVTYVASNTDVYATFAQNTYVNTQLGLKLNAANPAATGNLTVSSSTTNANIENTSTDVHLNLNTPTGHIAYIDGYAGGVNIGEMSWSSPTAYFGSFTGNVEIQAAGGSKNIVLDAVGGTIVNQALSVVGKTTTAASATGGAGLNLPHGVAPTTPANGDIWTTTGGVFVRIAGATVALGSGSGDVTNTYLQSTFTNTSVLTATYAPKASPQFSGNAQFANAYFANAVTFANTVAINGYLTANQATFHDFFEVRATAAAADATLELHSGSTSGNSGIDFYGPAGGAKGSVRYDNINSEFRVESGAGSSLPLNLTGDFDINLIATGGGVNIVRRSAGATGLSIDSNTATIPYIDFHVQGAYKGSVTHDTSFGFGLTAAAGVRLNAATGSSVLLQVNNANVAVVNAAGITAISGKVTTVASAAGGAGLILPHGAAPTTPANGDIWTTTSGLFVRVAGTTVGPLVDSGTVSGSGYAGNTYVNSTFALKAGDTFTGKVNTAASATGGAGFNIPHGAAPTTPANGDIWTTTGGLFAQIASTTHQFANISYAASNSSVYSTFAQNTAVYSTFSQNTYVNTQLGLKADLTGASFTGAVSSTSTISGTNITAGGNTIGTAAAANAVPFIDTRSVNDLPSGIATHQLTCAFKSSSNVANPPVEAGSGYSQIVNIQGWDAGGSGGWVSQLSVGDGIAVRQATNSTNWGTWRKVWHDGILDPTTFASNTTMYSTFAQNTAVYSTFAQNTAVYSTFSQNTYVNTELGKRGLKGFAMWSPGKPTSAQLWGAVQVPYTMTINATTCLAKCNVATTSATTLIIKNNGTQIGNVVFSAAATLGTVNITSGSVAANDYITVHANTTVDATFADFNITFRE